MEQDDATKDDLQRRSGLRLAGVFAFGDLFPEPGMYWGLLDGRGTGRFVMQTIEVCIGRLDPGWQTGSAKPSSPTGSGP